MTLRGRWLTMGVSIVFNSAILILKYDLDALNIFRFIRKQIFPGHLCYFGYFPII